MNHSTGSDWWQLLRAGNVFTAMSNILAGYMLALGDWQPVLPLALLVISSASLYLAGMVLNDVFDLELDRVERPERPLPAGRIDVGLATVVGWGFVLNGLLTAGLAAWLLASWLPIIVAALLTTAIVAYDAILKSTACGPLAMGVCRSINILLGASAVGSDSIPTAAYLFAIAIGIYTVGLTLLARDEATQTSASQLSLACNVVQGGILAILLLATMPTLPKYGWFAAWIVCFLAIRVFLYEPVMSLTPAAVQKSVSRLITMFIPLDALACAAAGGWFAALAVLLLLIPTYIATRRVAMT